MALFSKDPIKIHCQPNMPLMLYSSSGLGWMKIYIMEQ